MVAVAVEGAARAVTVEARDITVEARVVTVVRMAHLEDPHGPPSSILGPGPFTCGLGPTPVVLVVLHLKWALLCLLRSKL